MKTLTIRTNQNEEFQDITREINSYVRESNANNGILCIHVPHTTAAVTINENADPDVVRDMLFGLDKISPILRSYHHMEGNSHAHIKSTLVGVDQTIMIHDGRLVLGTWQGIYFCEFDGPRTRKIHLSIISSE